MNSTDALSGDEDPGGLAPIICLAEARRKREAEKSQPVPLADSATEQQHVLTSAVRSGRLAAADLFAMVRLGIVTDQTGTLPCADPHRKNNAADWEQRYAAHLAGQRAAAPGGRGASGAASAGNTAAPLLHAPSQVGCPLMAQAASGGAPACVEALRQQALIPLWRPGQGFVRRAVDPADPVVVHEVRPCLLLGRELFRQFLFPLWQE